LRLRLPAGKRALTPFSPCDPRIGGPRRPSVECVHSGTATGRAALISVNEARIGVIGLGYVGLPLALEFGRHYPTVGFDINAARIAELEAGRDSTREADAAEIAAATKLKYATDPQALLDCNVYVVTVPTPVASDKRP